MNAIALKVTEDYTLSGEMVWARPRHNAPHLSVVPDPDVIPGVQPVRVSLDASREPAWLPDVVEKINSLLALPENWDSYGAERIKLDAALNTVKLLLSAMEEYTPLPAIVPVSSGNLQVEWHVFDRDLEIEIGSHDYRILDTDSSPFQIDDTGAYCRSVSELTELAINERQG